MSVLYKALQKAEKENEQRQGPSGGIDTEKLVGSGAVKLAGGRGVNWRVTGLAAAVVLAVAIGAAFFLVDTSSPPPRQVAAVPVVTTSPGAAPAQAPVLQPPAPPSPAAANAPSAPAPAPPEAAVATATPAETPAAPETVPEEQESETAPAPAKTAVVAKAVAPKPARREPQPEIPADSPARMLSPPVSINRAEFALSGVGRAVQVREVSQEAQDSVGVAYTALLRGDYDMALASYDRALQKEPTSVLALLGRGAALHKLRRNDEAQASYEHVLRVDPNNREALTNLTALTAERSPAEALNRLLELEKDNPSFSPIKAEIGLVYAKTGAMEPALDYLRRAAALNPDATMYQYNLAVVLDHMGLGDQAIASYERVLSALGSGRGPADLSANDIERRVRFLRVK